MEEGSYIDRDGKEWMCISININMHEIAKYILVLLAKFLSFVLPTWDIYGGIYVLYLCHILTHMNAYPSTLKRVTHMCM